MKIDQDQEILKRLDAIVFLLLEIKDKEKRMPTKEKIKLLNDLGMNYTQIAKVLGKKPGHVAVELSLIKKVEKKQLNIERPETKNNTLEKTSIPGEAEVKNGQES